MPKKTLFVADPYNDEQLKMISEFEIENGLKNNFSLYLKEISKKYSKEEYNYMIKSSNEIQEYLFLNEDGKIIDSCSLNAYKDIKSCYLQLPDSKKISQRKKLLSLATEHAFRLGMLEVFATINSYDRALYEILEIDGYENLGEENGIVSFVKSFEMKEN